ncbi:MAG TPA: adenylate/guanylate cyclase domain-containing protein [bacterium]|nr:adenylate/guanylate cyclase domain-containing protein [bacterium]
MRCPQCGFDNPSGAKFCGRCGTMLGVRCPRCGAANPPDFVFCASCGARLTPERGPLAGREERKVVSVVFADVVGSTAAAAGRDPEEMRGILGRFFEAMQGEVERFGGTVEKFIGDAVMAVFGLPRAHEDDPERAVRCALAMAERLASLNEEFRPLHVALQIRVGVNTGEVVADPQAAEKGEFLITGDAVNVAARLQQAADPGVILIGERTRHHLRGVMECIEQPPLTVGGRDAPVPAWRVLGLFPQRRKRGLLGLRAPMIGRGQEMELLTAHFRKVAGDRQPYLVTIVGAAGVGKSRLQEEFTASLAALPAAPAIFKGRCLPYGDGITFWPLAEILKTECGILDSDTAEVARGKLEASVQRWLPGQPVARRTAEALGFTIGIQFPGSVLASLDPRAVREEILHAWREFLEARTRGGALVLVFEDLHWADESLLDLLEYLADRLNAPTLLLCLARPELLDRRPTWGGGKRNWAMVRLRPLREEENRRLVSELLRIEDLPENLRATIVSATEGNPFFTEEILRMLIDEGVLVREDGRWRAPEGPVEVRVPENVQGVLAARLDALPGEEKDLLQQASVIGRVFWLTPLFRLTSLPGGRLGDLLDRLEQRDLIEERDHAAFAGEREFMFRHVLVRDVAFGTLPRGRRAHPHAVADWLEGVAGERIDEFAELVAHHCHQAALLGGDLSAQQRALRYLLLAGDVAARKYATSAALRSYESALAFASTPLERMTIFERIGDLQTVQWLGDAGWEYHWRALDQWRQAGAPDPIAGARLYAKLAENPTRWRGAFHVPPPEGEILRCIEDGLRLLDGLPDSVERGRLHAARGLLPNYTGREVESEIREALAHSLEAARIMEQHGSARDLSAALDAVQGAYRQLADYPAALQANLRRWALRPEIVQRDELIDIGCMMASSRVALGDYPEAVEAAQWAARLGEEAALGGWHLHPMMWRTLALFEWDRWDEAARSAQEFVRARERYGNPYHTWVGTVLMIMAIISARRGEIDRAQRLAREAEEYPFRVPGTSHLPAVMLIASGDTDAARRRLELLRTGDGRLQPAVWSLLAEVAATSLAPEFGGLHREASELATRAGARKPIARLRRAEGIWHLLAGRSGEAERTLRDALAEFRALDARWEVAQTLVRLSEACRRVQKEHAALEARKEAETLFLDLGAAGDLAVLRAIP